MVLVYLVRYASTLTLIKIKLSRKSMMLAARNLGYQCKIGISALLGEATMGMLMFTGNLAFMYYLGDAGVGAFSIACYYCPFAFMIGNAIAQLYQPIISYNYGLGEYRRAAHTERLAIITAIASGAIVTLAFTLMPGVLVGFFLTPDSASAQIAEQGFPLFSTSFVFFIFNLTAIGYYQSIEKVAPSVVFALLRGLVLLVPSFIFMPKILGTTGIWLALAVSEFLTSAAILCYYLSSHRLTRQQPLHLR